MHFIERTIGEGSFAVRLSLIDTGRGLSGTLTGGDSPHVGRVVLAVPRASLANAENPSCDLYTVPVPGHLDYVVAQRMATELCRSTGQPVSITSGIHIDHATPGDISLIEEICRELTRFAIKELSTKFPE